MSVTKELKSYLFDFDSESRIEALVQCHQATIIELVDLLAGSNHNSSGGSATGRSKNALWKLLNDQLENLLTFIETYFLKYFDQDQKIPNSYLALERTSLSKKTSAIHSIVRTAQLDNRLIDIIFYPVERIISSNVNAVTYRRLIFIKQLLKDLETVLSVDTGRPVIEDVFRLMIYLNFNSCHLTSYFIKAIANEAQEQHSVATQLEVLCHWLKITNQNHTKPSFVLKTARPSLQEQITRWLSEEINFIEKKKQLTLLMPPTVAAEQKEPVKVDTSFSVPQLAFLIRLFKEAGVITNKNQTELIRFFSRHFNSLHNQNISTESLRIKYYQIEQSTIKSVQAILDKMIDHSKKAKWFLVYFTTDACYDLAIELLFGFKIF